MKKSLFGSKLTREEAKSVCFGALCEVDDFCKASGIKYFLHYGTLLGAARHKGFIPWDDDADIAMPRPDYEKFLREFKSEGFFLFTRKNAKRLAVPFAKVCSKNVACFRGDYLCDYSLGLDIFPIDGVPSEKDDQEKYFREQLSIFFDIWKRRFSSEEIAECDTRYNAAKKILRKLANFFFSSKRGAAIAEKNAKKFCYEKSEFVGCNVCLFWRKKRIVPKSCVENLTLLPFEGRLFPAPASYDFLLRLIYGDYMTPPPKEDRESSHAETCFWRIAKKVCVVGGGNIGTYAAFCAKQKGCFVSLYARDKSKIQKSILVNDLDKSETRSFFPDCVTSDLKKAAKNSDAIFITYPAFLFSDFAKKLLPYVSEKSAICVLPGTGGAEFAFFDCIKKGAKFFGLQRVPVVARLSEYGKELNICGKKPGLHLGALNASPVEKEKFRAFLERIFCTKCEALPNYLCVTLTPSNPILHTSRLCSMFKNYKEGIFYEENFLFYEEWTLEASKILLDLDMELQNLCEKASELDLKSVLSLKKYYESENAQELTEKLRSIRGFKKIRSPMKKEAGGWIPDFSDRYFSADFPFGLKVLIEIARLFGVATPSMNSVWNWFESVCPDLAKNSFSLGFESRAEFAKFYKG